MSDACPECGYVLTDLYEHFPNCEEDVETECPNCEAPIVITRHVVYVIRAQKPQQ